jgi:hypothetical protein
LGERLAQPVTTTSACKAPQVLRGQQKLHMTLI